jgi:hypothetical protein
MTNELQNLAELARSIWSDDAVSSDDFGFALETGGDTLTFFSPSESPETLYCRAKVAPLVAETCPAGFAEDLLGGNFFWTGTRGGTLSFNEKDGIIYLTDRLDTGALDGEDALAGYVADFTRTLDDWRVRRAVYIKEEAL